MATAGQPLQRASRLASRIDRRQAAGKQTGQAERRLDRIHVGDAQLGYGLNSTDPRLQQQAQDQFRRQLQRTQGGQGQAKNPGAGSAGQNPLQVKTQPMQQPVQNTMVPNAPGGGQTTVPQGGPSYNDALAASFGGQNPFGVRELGGPNPLETAKAAAQRMLSENLAGVNSRFAAAGSGNSDRAALANAQAISDTSTFLGDKLATIGENAYQNDANRGLSAILGAGQLDQGQQQIALAMNQALGNFGTGLTGIGSQETGIPNLGEIMGILAAFGRTGGQGTSKGSGAQGFGWKR